MVGRRRAGIATCAAGVLVCCAAFLTSASAPGSARFRWQGHGQVAGAWAPAAAAAAESEVQIAADRKGAEKGAVATSRQALVIFARFADEPAQPLPAWSGALLDADASASPSHFYQTMSFGALRLAGQVAPRAYASAGPASAYVAASATERGRYGQFALQILRQADADVDLGRFDQDGDGFVDAVFLVLASTPRNFLLGDATGISGLGLDTVYVSDDRNAAGARMRIDPRLGSLQRGRTFAEAAGAMCHEYGHVLGLPDLYNIAWLRDRASGPAEDSGGIGSWGLMGHGASGWGGAGGPAALCAWSRQKLGWTPVDTMEQVTEQVELQDIDAGGAAYRIPLAGREYFLLELRRRAGYYNRDIPAEGVLIWHVIERPLQYQLGDPLPGAEAPLATQVDLECADGRWLDAGYPDGRAAAAASGGDNLDFWAHDQDYTRSHAGNLGDATDPFDGVRFTRFTAAGNPAACSHDGQVCVSVEDIRIDGGVATMQVTGSPAAVVPTDFRLTDADGDSIPEVGEPVELGFSLVHLGGLAGAGLSVRLRTDDPLVRVLVSRVTFGALAVGQTEPYRGLRERLTFRFADELVGTHRARLVVEAYEGSRLAGSCVLEVVGLGARHDTPVVAILDTTGNGDGQAQVGETIHLLVGLPASEPAALRGAALSLQPLDDGVERLGPDVVTLDSLGQTARSPGFLLLASLPAGDDLRFELAVQAYRQVWRDTLTVALAPGPDRTPPQVGAVVSRPDDGSLRLLLPAANVVDGSAIATAEVTVWSPTDTQWVATVRLARESYGYGGVWVGPAPGRYLAAAAATDAAGNRGTGPLQELVVTSGGSGAGSGWTAVEPPAAPWALSLHGAVYSPADPRVLYLRSEHHVFRSADGGATWNHAGRLMGGTGMVADPADPQVVYAQGKLHDDFLSSVDDIRTTANLVWMRSEDQARSWQALRPGPYPWLADPGRGLLYATELSRFLASADHGRTWEDLGGPVGVGYDHGWQEARNDALGFLPFAAAVGRDPGALLLAWRHRSYPPGFAALAASRDGGHSWRATALPRPMRELAADYRQPGHLFGSTPDTIWHTIDLGASWEPVSHGLSDRWARLSLATHPGAPQWLAAWDFADLWISTDAGLTWGTKRPLPGALAGVRESYDMGRLAVLQNPSDPQAFLLRGLPREAAMWRTTDAGLSWARLELPHVWPPIGCLNVGGDGRLRLGAGIGLTQDLSRLRLYSVSGDPGGWTWADGNLVSSGALPVGVQVPEDLLVDPRDSRIMLACLDQCLVRTEDAGVHWGNLSLEGLAYVRGQGYPRLLVDPHVAGAYYFKHARIWRSADYGRTWAQIGAGLPPAFDVVTGLIGPRSAFAVDPAEDGVLYAGVREELWTSRDRGQSWERVTSLASGHGFVLLDIHPGAPDTLVAATTEGVQVSGDCGVTWRQLLRVRLDPLLKNRLRLGPEPGQILLSTGTELWVTLDGGTTWEQIGAGISDTPWFGDAVFDPFDPRTVYAATPWGLFQRRLAGPATAVTDGQAAPAAFALLPSFPNPFNATTVIHWRLPVAASATLALYDVLGQRVRTLVDGPVAAGEQHVVWDGRDHRGRPAATGVYVVRLATGSVVRVQRVLLLR